MQDTAQHPEIMPDYLIPSAMEALFSHQRFLAGMQAFLPHPLPDLILSQKDSIRTIADFQSKIVLQVLKFIEKASITTLTTSGLEKLDCDQQYLFISNHRDIVLDSAFLNTTLFEHGFRTSQIAIGDNLMKHQLSELIFKMNKSFVVKRSGTPMELYRYSVLLSEHIHRQISEKIDSVWIAQREGRAKDGNDVTQTGMLKMLSLNCKTDLKSYFKSLHIVPVSISYEYLPCDVLQAQEFLNKRQNPEYKKTFEEDLQHMLQGLKGPKGRVHFHFYTPLTDELDIFDTLPNAKRQLEELANILDRSIHQNYRLHAINEVAQNLRMGTVDYSDSVSSSEIEAITAYFEAKKAQLKGDADGAGWEYLLGMYANPLVNAR